LRKFGGDPLDPWTALAFVGEHELELTDSENGTRLEFLRHPIADACRHDPEAGVILDQIEGFTRGGWLLHDLWFETGALTLFNQPIANLGLHSLG
jgi:hypothetical protein